ncbi:Crp/Fnr family transcriptional regulator [Streptomyces telluris]|uniref:Crp/Fnr family transcriptional regulator n=1 Tax=Streptomyces telluris TaxID=2720021 RepID=A0A9X2LMQ5_9ACTN|nr:Crp/Fnr family transcriptional regulator [Streptomyces telluris]MCQ8774062.1 Crp/Fnr family transcriptional regulator [Streptomyces telluris]
MSAPVRAELLQLGSRCRYLPREVLMREGDCSSRDVALLLSGLVKVTKRLGNGKQALLAVRADGDIVGEMAALDDDASRSATVTACGEVYARIVCKSELQAFLRAYPEAFQAVAAVISQRLRWANHARIDFGSCTVKVRLARTLAQLAYTHGRPVRSGIVISVNLSQFELAALVGSTKQTVHKELVKMRNDGIVEVNYSQQIVRDIARLREVARLGVPERSGRMKSH